MTPLQTLSLSTDDLSVFILVTLLLLFLTVSPFLMIYFWRETKKLRKENKQLLAKLSHNLQHQQTTFGKKET